MKKTTKDIRKKQDNVVYTNGVPTFLDTPDYEFDFSQLSGSSDFLPTVTFTT